MAENTDNRHLELRFETPSSQIMKSQCYFNDVFQKIQEFFYDKRFCDITLVSSEDENYKIQAHKIILCASSEVFLAMLGGSMREAKEKEIRVDVSGFILELVIKYIYTATIELSTDNVEEVLITACIYQLSSLKELCCEFIEPLIDPSNCLGIAILAETYNLGDLYKSAKCFACKHFTDLRNEQEFYKLEVSMLSSFLSSSDLSVDSEEDVFRSIMSWINHDRDNREKFLCELLNEVRFPLLAPEFIANSIEPACKSIECERLILKAYKWHLLPNMGLNLYKKENMELRNFKKMIIAISGFNRDGGQLNFDICYPKKKENGWIRKPEISGLKSGRNNFASCVFKGQLIIAGGVCSHTRKCLSQLDCLDLKTFKWSSMTPMPTNRQSFGLVTLNGYLYAIGGENFGMRCLNSVERYDPKTKSWNYVTSMNRSERIFKCVSVSSNKLFASYKYGNNFEHHLYDPESNTWIYDWLASSRETLIGTGTVNIFNNEFFLVVYKNSILRYNLKIKSSETFAINSDIVLSQFYNCAAFGDRLIVYSNTHFLEYNSLSNHWTELPKLENNNEDVVFVLN